MESKQDIVDKIVGIVKKERVNSLHAITNAINIINEYRPGILDKEQLNQWRSISTTLLEAYDTRVNDMSPLVNALIEICNE